MSQLRSTFFSLMLISSAFAVTACGPQAQPETEQAPTTEQPDKTASSGKCNQPGRTYVSRDEVECLSITWSCPEGEEQFLDSCGCGCQ